MAQLIVRNLDPELVARLKLRAAEHGHSAEAEHREILRQALAVEPRRSFRELAAKVRSMTSGRAHTSSEVLLREGRDER
jgi:antitoxin FitA